MSIREAGVSNLPQQPVMIEMLATHLFHVRDHLYLSSSH